MLIKLPTSFEINLSVSTNLIFLREMKFKLFISNKSCRNKALHRELIRGHGLLSFPDLLVTYLFIFIVC